MNLLFLVEGETTEYKIYRAWLAHLFPDLSFSSRLEDSTTNSYRIIIGYGYPSILDRIKSCLTDIKDHYTVNVDHFFICLDSEDVTYESRFNEINDRLESLKVEVGIDESQATKFHIIVQNCCIETWFLGNAEIPKKNELRKRKKLSDFQAHYNVVVDDPELMVDYPPSYYYRRKAKFHKDYLDEYLKGFGLPYSRKDPIIIAEKEYLDALIKRCASTKHLSSLKYLLDIWEEMRNT